MDQGSRAAEANSPETRSGERLESWKDIAAYLKRDVRTVQRWEKLDGLPIYRHGPGRLGGVYAYKAELDGWWDSVPGRVAAASATDEGVRLAPAVDAVPRAAQSPSAPAPAGPTRARWRAWGVAAGLLVVAGGILWQVMSPRANEPPERVELTPVGIVAHDDAGTERWRYRFPADERVRLASNHVETLGGSNAAIFVATAFRIHNADEVVRGGQLLWLTPRGALQRTFSFDDHLAFGAGEYGAPWAIVDFRVNEPNGTRRVAVAAHHYQWWPSMVTILDEGWQRRGTFVNAGWMERAHWLAPDRLLVSGFSEVFDGGMIALLDANALDGQSPVAADSPFYCTTCGTGRPLRYIVMPRSELNRVTVSRFNRAWLDHGADRVVVRTVEVPAAEAEAIDALYAFTPSLDLISASFSARYWDVHRALEAQGRLDHTREQCPDRDGPREIHVWEPQTGWRTLKTSTRAERRP